MALVSCRGWWILGIVQQPQWIVPVIVDETTASSLLSRLPLVLLFVGGYVASRLLAETRLTNAFVLRVLARARGGLWAVCGAVIVAGAALSLFIPNAVTVLALLPVLSELDRAYAGRGVRATTALTLSAIYGANIGGMGSLVGSPANMLLIGALEVFQVPGREQITFLNWFLWALPLVFVVCGVSWLVVRLAIPGRRQKRGSGLGEGPATAEWHGMEVIPLTPWQRSACVLFVQFLLFWIASSLASGLIPAYARYEAAVAAGFTIYYIYVCVRPSGPGCCATKEPLLTLRALFSGLPRRGLVFLALVGALIVAAGQTGLDDRAVLLFESVLGADAPMYLVLVGTCLTVIFLTEVLSNTVVSVAFFAVAYHAALTHGADPLPIMIAVSCASTCAFMTPIATPCNALAYGEMRGVSLRGMLGLGLVLNLLCGLLMAGWLGMIIPLVYG